MSTSSSLHASVSYAKIAGTLSVENNFTLHWKPSLRSSSASPFAIAFADIAGLQTSKPGAAQIALNLVLANGIQVGGKPKVLLVFNSDKTAENDRERFKIELAAAVARNRAATGEGSTPASPAPAALATSSPATAATPDTRPATPVVNSQTGQRRPRDLPPPKTDIELRISVIKSNPALRALHKDIVISGAMSDAEFWSHPSRQRLLAAERSKLSQLPGRNARLADPKPTPNEAGELKLSITPELIRDLFEQFPVVARAYEENVPSKLDEGSFWTRYFQSKLYHRLRTSARSAASEGLVQDDAIFDQYLEGEDDGLEPRRRHFNPHDRLLDLASTEEDHGETGNARDFTMRAGAERRTLPLMRRFNDHSQSLLDSALGDQEEEERRKKRRIVGGVGEEYDSSGNPPKLGGSAYDEDEGMEEAADSVDWIKNHYYKDIVIDDLQEDASTEKVRLNMANLENYFSTSSGETMESSKPSTSVQKTKKDSYEVVPKNVSEYLGYVDKFNATVERTNIELGLFKPTSAGSENSMARMLANLRSRSLNPRAGSDLKTLPEAVQKGLVSLQASTTEFLRQFWNAIAPAPSDPLLNEPHDATWSARTAPASAAAREEREKEAAENRLVAARKMALNLVKFEPKLDELFNTTGRGVDEELEAKVEALLAPTRRAVERAVDIARSKGLIA